MICAPRYGEILALQIHAPQAGQLRETRRIGERPSDADHSPGGGERLLERFIRCDEIDRASSSATAGMSVSGRNCREMPRSTGSLTTASASPLLRRAVAVMTGCPGWGADLRQHRALPMRTADRAGSARDLPDVMPDSPEDLIARKK